MKPKPDFDPMFQANRRRGYRPILVIGLLMIVAALSGLVMGAGPIRARRPVSPPLQVAPMPGGYFAVQGSVPNTRPVRVQPRDRFVIVAPAEIDRAMVIRVRDDLDAAMVINPETGRRGSTPTVPAPAFGPTVPEGYRPVPSSPQPRVAPQPR
jgi:hypothetical protein